MATRWIPGGVGLYIAFAVMAPRLHALSKRRGYFTISEVLFDRYSCPSSSHPLVRALLARGSPGLHAPPRALLPPAPPPPWLDDTSPLPAAPAGPVALVARILPAQASIPSGPAPWLAIRDCRTSTPPFAVWRSPKPRPDLHRPLSCLLYPQVAHAIHLITFFCLQLPVFTYLITQFQAVGREVRTFTYGEITATTAICVGAAVLLLCDLLGGMRAVAYTGGTGCGSSACVLANAAAGTAVAAKGCELACTVQLRLARKACAPACVCPSYHRRCSRR